MLQLLPPIRDNDWQSVRKALQVLTSTVMGVQASPTFAGLTVSAGPLDVTGKITAGSFASPIDVTNTGQYGMELHYSGNDYDATGIRSRAQLVTTDASTRTALGGLFQAANNDNIDAGVLMGFMAEAIGKSTSNASTITTMRGGLIGTEWGALDTVTNLKTLHLRGHSLNAAGAGSFGTGYALYIENEAVGGNGQAYDAGIYFKDTNLSAGNKAFTYGIDFSGGSYGTAEIKFSNGETIDNLIDGNIRISGNLVIPDGGTIGQAAGPLLTFDDTNDWLEITGCQVAIGTNTPDNEMSAELLVYRGDSGATGAHGSCALVIEGDTTIGGGSELGLGILTPNDQTQVIMFGDPEDTYAGGIVYDHSVDTMQLRVDSAMRLTLGPTGILTMTGNLIIPDAGYIGSVSDTDALQIEADGDIVMSQDLAVTGSLVVSNGIEVIKEAANAEHIISCYHDTEATTSLLTLRKADNTFASPALVDDDAVLGRISFWGYNGSSFVEGARIEARIDGATSGGGTGLPTELTFWTCFNEVGIPGQIFSIQPNGNWLLTGTRNFTMDSAVDAHIILDCGNASRESLIYFQQAGADKWVVGLIDSSNYANSDGDEFSIGLTDSSSLFWIDPTGLIGFGGETSPETLFELTHASPYITGHCSTESDANESGLFKIVGKREDGAGTETESGHIKMWHDGAGVNDQLAKMTLGVNTGAGVVDALEIGSDLLATFAGSVMAATHIGGVASGDDLTFQSTSHGTKGHFMFDSGVTITGATGPGRTSSQVRIMPGIAHPGTEAVLCVGDQSGTLVDLCAIRAIGDWVYLSQVQAISTEASGPTRGGGMLVYSDDGAALASGDRLGYFLFGGSKSASAYGNGAGITAFATELWDASGIGTEFRFETCANNSTSRVARLIIQNDGGIRMPNMKSGTDQTDAGAATGELYADTNDGNTVKLGV